MVNSGKFLKDLLSALEVSTIEFSGWVGRTDRQVRNWFDAEIPAVAERDIAEALKIPLPVFKAAARGGADLPAKYLDARDLLARRAGLPLRKLPDAGPVPASAFNVLPGERRLYSIPRYNLPPSASHWSELVDAADQTDESKRDPRAVDQGLFSVHISGDCMEPRWHHGEQIIFEIWRQGREPFPLGRDVALTNSDGLTTFKTLVRFEPDSGDDNDGVIVLQARNVEKYPEEIRVPMQMVARIAVAVGVFQVR